MCPFVVFLRGCSDIAIINILLGFSQASEPMMSSLLHIV
jgi:hypothetical protein